VEVISQFLGGLVVIVGDTEFELALLGAEHDRLAVHAPDQVEGRLGFAAQSQLQQIFLDAGFEGLAQLGLNLEEAVRRAQALDPLVRPFVVVIFDPEFDALAGSVEALELGAHQELLPDRGPEPFHLAQGHRMVRPRFDMVDPVLLELGFEPAGAAPGGVLPPVVGEHFLGRFELGDRHPIDFNHRLGGGAAKQIRADHVPGIVIQEGDQVGVAAAQPERENITLPHLVGRGPLEEAGPGELGFLFRRRRRGHQVGFLQPLAHGGGTGRQQEPPAQ
jgi:hypothetical protein